MLQSWTFYHVSTEMLAFLTPVASQGTATFPPTRMDSTNRAGILPKVCPRHFNNMSVSCVEHLYNLQS